MTILITGATGFIGSYLLDKLLYDTNYNIIILKRSTSDIFRISNLLQKVKVYDADTINLEEIFKRNKINGIVHLATNYVKAHNLHSISSLIESNITLPTKLIELSAIYGVRYFINTGTFFEYSFNCNPVTEESQIKPYNLYAATKLAFNNVLEYYGSNTSLNILTLKLAAPFGYKDNQKLVPYLIKSLLNNEKVILEKGEQEWDFIYVKDVVSAYISAIELCINTKRSIFEEILIGTSEKTSIKKMVETINGLHGKEMIFLEKEYQPNQIFTVYLDNSKAKNMLQWVPKYSIEDGLEETYNLYKASKNER